MEYQKKKGIKRNYLLLVQLLENQGSGRIQITEDWVSCAAREAVFNQRRYIHLGFYNCLSETLDKDSEMFRLLFSLLN